MRHLVGLFLVGLLMLSVQVEAQEPQNIVRDYQNDVEGDPDKPLRLRLKKESGLEMGRMAVVWGSIGGSDTADSFFLGKTPDKARLQFDLTALEGGGRVQLIVTAKDGQNVERHEIEVVSGGNQKSWLRLKGSLVAQVAGAVPTNYALYVWYPGDTVDALAKNEFEDVTSNQGMEKPRMLRAVKGGGK